MITKFKIFENVQFSKKVLRELDIPQDDKRYIKLRELLHNNLGYLGKFTQWMFKDNISLDHLKNIYTELQGIKLDKPIDSFNDPEELYDYITQLKISTKVNQVIKSLPSRSRKLVNTQLTELISNNIKYSNNIKDFYAKKGGRYKNSKDLINDTKSLIKNLSGGWSVDSIKYNEDELVYKDDHTLILHIDSYDRSCELGSQHWCISTSKDQWSSYTSDFNKQYFIYDFTKDIGDKKSMIGVTIDSGSRIRNAHYKDDTEVNDLNELSVYKKYLTPYSKEYIKSKIDFNDIIEVAKYGFVDQVKKLIEQGVDPSVDDNSAIRWASENGYLEVVKQLLQDPRVDPGDYNNYAIRWASRDGHLEVVKLLIQDSRVDPSDNNNSAIRAASINGHFEVVKLLLQDPRVDPGDYNNYAIQSASRNGHLEVVKLLLQDSRVDPSVDNNYAIRAGSENGHLEVVKLLLQDKRVDPSDKDNYAIRWASEYGHFEVVKQLLQDSRVDPSDKDNYAIRYASENDHLEIVKLLLQDKRVISKLSDDDIRMYKSQV